MKLPKKKIAKIGIGVILGGIAGIGISYVYGLVGVT
jgi:hypothetical protein